MTFHSYSYPCRRVGQKSHVKSEALVNENRITLIKRLSHTQLCITYIFVLDLRVHFCPPLFRRICLEFVGIRHMFAILHLHLNNHVLTRNSTQHQVKVSSFSWILLRVNGIESSFQFSFWLFMLPLITGIT